MSGKRIVEVALVTTSSSTSKIHALDPDRHTRTRCGLRDEFDWDSYPTALNAIDDVLDALSDHTEGTP